MYIYIYIISEGKTHPKDPSLSGDQVIPRPGAAARRGWARRPRGTPPDLGVPNPKTTYLEQVGTFSGECQQSVHFPVDFHRFEQSPCICLAGYNRCKYG